MLRRSMVAGVLVLSLAACGAAASGSNSEAEPPPNADPKKGWVQVWEDDSYYKRCDGTTLIYERRNQDYGHSTATDDDSAECK